MSESTVLSLSLPPDKRFLDRNMMATEYKVEQRSKEDENKDLKNNLAAIIEPTTVTRDTLGHQENYVILE
jgi:hypothetical protein